VTPILFFYGGIKMNEKFKVEYCKSWVIVDGHRVYCVLEKGHEGSHLGYIYEEGSGATYEVTWEKGHKPIIWDEEQIYEFTH
jgi:hypothetical protein